MKFANYKLFLPLFILVFIWGCAEMKDLKIGKYPDNPKEVDLDVFIPIWIENDSLVKMPFHNLYESRRDSLYVFFNKNDYDQKIYIKVPLSRLTSIDYMSIDGKSIHKKFYAEFVPSEIKTRNNNEGSLSHTLNYTYLFIDSTSSIKIKCHYVIRNDIGIKVNEETYSAIYNIKDKTLK